MRANQQDSPCWKMPTMIPVAHEMIEEMLKNAEAQLKELVETQKKPHTFDRTALKQIMADCEKEMRKIPIHQEQCRRWRTDNLNRRQLMWVGQMEDMLVLLSQALVEIESLTGELKSNTCGKQTSKEEGAITA